jgi:predicted DNA-binding ribbon-helix-helix protein
MQARTLSSFALMNADKVARASNLCPERSVIWARWFHPLARGYGGGLWLYDKSGCGRHREAAMCNLFISQNPSSYQAETRAIRLHGYSTSIRLEAAFWSTLEEIAAKEHLTLARFVTVLYEEIVEKIGDVQNFTSFLRVTCLHYLNNQERHSLQVAMRLNQVDAPAELVS